MVEVKQNLREYLSKENILCNVSERDGRKVMTDLLLLLKRSFAELNVEETLCSIQKREEIFSTIVTPGLAIPHTRLAALKHPLIAVACSPAGIDFPTPDQKVNVMVVLLTPLDEPNLHLQVISALAQFFSTGDEIRQAAQFTDPDRLLEFFDPERTGIPEYLTARDVMINVEPVRENEPVSAILERLSTSRFLEFPVVDHEGHLRGEVSMADLLRYCIPSYYQWMEDLTPIGKFQTLADFLNKASDTRTCDVVRQNSYKTVKPDTPVAQLALDFIKNDLSQILVVDNEKKLLGTVELRSFCAKFFWE